MYALALFFLLNQPYFLVSAQKQIVPTANGYDMKVHFRNSGNQNATCEAHVDDQYKDFAIMAFGRDDETFQNVNEYASVSLTCQATH